MRIRRCWTEIILRASPGLQNCFTSSVLLLRVRVYTSFVIFVARSPPFVEVLPSSCIRISLRCACHTPPLSLPLDPGPSALPSSRLSCSLRCESKARSPASSVTYNYHRSHAILLSLNSNWLVTLVACLEHLIAGRTVIIPNMKGVGTLVIAAGLLSAPAGAIQLHKRTDGPARVVGFPIERRSISNPLLRDRLRRRSETVQVSLDNEVSQARPGGYSAC